MVGTVGFAGCHRTIAPSPDAVTTRLPSALVAMRPISTPRMSGPSPWTGPGHRSARLRSSAFHAWRLPSANPPNRRTGPDDQPYVIPRAETASKGARAPDAWTPSQNRTVWSADPDTTVRPSGLNVSDEIPLAWPRSVSSRRPLAASQNRTVVSNEPVATRAPSGENATAVTPVLVTGQAGQFLSVEVPHPCDVVLSAGNDASAFVVESHREYRAIVTLQDGGPGGSGNLPDSHRAVVGGRRHARPVRTENGLGDAVAVPREDRLGLPRFGVPDPNHAGPRSTSRRGVRRS